MANRKLSAFLALILIGRAPMPAWGPRWAGLEASQANLIPFPQFKHGTWPLGLVLDSPAGLCWTLGISLP